MSLRAHVVRIVVEERQSPAYGGRTFGNAGAYERLSGHIFGELDPANPANVLITDLSLAPRNSRGFVEYSATFVLLKPVDMSKASGVLIYDVPNRGNRLLLGAFQRGEPGDGFLFERGHVILASGWQGDLLSRADAQTITVPVAKNPNGSSIEGPVLLRYSDAPRGTTTMSLGHVAGGQPAHRPYATASMDPSRALLTLRTSEEGVVIPVASGDWAFADCTASPFPGTPDPNKLCLKNGFDPGYLYELSYTAKDPLVLGIGFAATRDIVSYMRHATGSENPVAGTIVKVIGQGISQSGNFVRSFIHLGFNRDEEKRIVWDGANDHIAGRQLPLNFRFAVPGGAAALYEPGSEAVLWWSAYADVARGRKSAGMLDRCRASNTCPKIFETFGSSEFWGLRMSPNLVGTAADRDIPLPQNVRRYYFPGTTHGGGRGGFATPAATPGGRCALVDNPNPESDSMRALLDALVDWVVKDTAPPESRYPHLADKQLVPPDRLSMRFPAMPSAPLPDHMLNTLLDYDFGPDFQYSDLMGVIARQPPAIKRVLPSLVPEVDADGNERSGIRSPLLSAPLGTYLGWNVTASGFSKGRACGFSGGFIPFAVTREERVKGGDPRRSMEERYASHDAYVALVKAAAEELVRERFLLRPDADRIVAEAAASAILK